MRTYLKLFCLLVPILVALDASWIGVIASGFYKSAFGGYFSATPNFLPAALFYLLYALALIYLVLDPALKERSLGRAMLSGSIVGFAAYMTYDLTNLTLLAAWPFLASFVDIAWGALMTSVACGLTYLVATKVFRM